MVKSPEHPAVASLYHEQRHETMWLQTESLWIAQQQHLNQSVHTTLHENNTNFKKERKKE